MILSRGPLFAAWVRVSERCFDLVSLAGGILPRLPLFVSSVAYRFSIVSIPVLGLGGKSVVPGLEPVLRTVGLLGLGVESGSVYGRDGDWEFGREVYLL